MEIRHEWVNGPEILFSSCDGEKSLQELKLLEPILKEPEHTGTARDDDGVPKKENRGISFDEIYTPLYAECSPTARVIEKFISTARTGEFTPNSAFQALYSMKGFNVLFSAYKNKDYYKPHRDSATLTVLMWLGQKDFEGGDLYLPDFDYIIPYEPNKLIMFPSYYQHEVTEISTEKEGFVRYCASAFIT